MKINCLFPSRFENNFLEIFFSFILDPKGGFYQTSVTVNMTSKTVGARISYTLNSSIPNNLSTTYFSPLTLSSTTVIRARAYLDGMIPSSITTQTYLILVPCRFISNCFDFYFLVFKNR